MKISVSILPSTKGVLERLEPLCGRTTTAMRKAAFPLQQNHGECTLVLRNEGDTSAGDPELQF